MIRLLENRGEGNMALASGRRLSKGRIEKDTQELLKKNDELLMVWKEQVKQARVVNRNKTKQLDRNIHVD